MCSYSSNTKTGGDILNLQNFFLTVLSFLASFVMQLDGFLEKRLVHTLSNLCQSIIRLPSRSTGLLLSELGGNLLSFDNAPAGTKWISNLLRSLRWEDKVIPDHLASQAHNYVEKLLEKKQEILLLRDETVHENPESIESEGLCAVRSSKENRLTRIKRGYYKPPVKSPNHVPGHNWVGLLLCGLKEAPRVAKPEWWTSRGKHAKTGSGTL